MVPVAQSRALIAAIGSDVAELVEYEGEGHGFRDPVNVRDEYLRTESFLEAATGAPHDRR